jgi:predicted nucleic acid-binding protein
LRLFLDANVLFSAGNAGSNIHRFLNLLRERHSLVTSGYAFCEAERNIHLKRPQWAEDFRRVMAGITLVADVPLTIDVTLADKDRAILGSAIASSSDYLLTGDKKDFGHLYGKNIGGVTVVSYTMLAESVLD